MLLDETSRQNARQDLLEALMSGVVPPCGAPMVYTLEMLEIVGSERRAAEHASIDRMFETGRLTAAKKPSRMPAWFEEAGKAFVDVANRLWRGVGTRRLHS